MTKRTAGLLAACVVFAIPIGFALGQSMGGDDAEPNGFDLSSLDCPESGLSVCDDPVEPAAGAPGTQDGVPEIGVNDAPGEDLYVVEVPSQNILETCKSGERPEAQCGLVLALGDGSVEPGTYPADELERQVAEAGYEWSAK